MSSVENSHTTPAFTIISQEDLNNQSILNEKLVQAASEGFVYLEIPKNCRKIIQAAEDFAGSFFTDESITGREFSSPSGYHQRENMQVESLYLHKDYWEDVLSEDLCVFAEEINSLATDILKKTLVVCGIETEDQSCITGRVSEGKGDTYLTFNYYNPDKKSENAQEELEGLNEHQDFGQITILYINKPGLEAFVDDQWRKIDPMKDHFIVNFGRALANSINDSTKLTASLHRVRHLKEPRISFGIFCDNAKEDTMYKMESGKSISTNKSFASYIKECFEELYKQNS